MCGFGVGVLLKFGHFVGRFPAFHIIFSSLSLSLLTVNPGLISGACFLLQQTHDYSVDVAPFVVTENMDRNAAFTVSIVANQHVTPVKTPLNEALLF